MSDSMALPRESRLERYIWLLAFAIAALSLLMGFWYHYNAYLAGGHPFIQGDWLINSINGPVRRGPLGSVIIHIGDWTGLGPLTVTVILQLSLMIIMTLPVLLAFWRLRIPAYALLLTSPGFFIVFWASSPTGSLRKEMIGLASICVLLLIPLLPKAFRGLVVAFSLLLFAIACIGHEVNTFMAPVLAALFVITLRPDLRSRVLWAAAAVFFALTAAALLYAMSQAQISDRAAVCDPLLERGLGKNICSGSIRWLTYDSAHARAELIRRLTAPGAALSFAVAATLVVAPLVYLVSLHDRARLLYGVLAACLLPVLPLFFVAHDWGRWLCIYITLFTVVIFALALQGRIRMVRPVNPVVLLTFVCLSFVWSPHHILGLQLGGIVKRILT
ncbi:hypothetical protein [uncultured Roseobacter sp.]|uniref:hypothetical protein n=1 Tax=uncultured Roseobacter sp. TaxID=114847 RepID=UPI0026214777|nr:hypothetical protein [uncultured Roseobacter sp.]